MAGISQAAPKRWKGWPEDVSGRGYGRIKAEGTWVQREWAHGLKQKERINWKREEKNKIRVLHTLSYYSAGFSGSPNN